MENLKEPFGDNNFQENPLNPPNQLNISNIQSSNHEKIKMKKIFKPIKKLILEEYIIFLCKGKTNLEKKEISKSNFCNSTLFSSPQVDMLLTYEKQNFSFVFNNLEKITRNAQNANFHIEDGFHNEDIELNQFDCIYSYLVCSNCLSRIGRVIHSTPTEKDFLLNKFLILNEKVQMINTYNGNGKNSNAIDLHKVEYSEYINCEAKESEEIQKLSEINSELFQTNEQVLLMTNKSRDYLKIKDNIRSTENYIENLNKLTKYVEYSFNRLGINSENNQNNQNNQNNLASN